MKKIIKNVAFNIDIFIDSGRKFNLIIPKCHEICYNISLYQTLFWEIQNKVDLIEKYRERKKSLKIKVF